MLEEMQKLRIKLEELKNNYEKSKKEREKISSEMHTLDDTLEMLDKAREEMQTQHKNYLANKEELKSCIKRAALPIIIGSIILGFVDLIIKNFNMISAVTYIIVVNIGIHVLPHLIKIARDKNSKRISVKENEMFENEYNKILEKRISIGQRYKRARDTEKFVYKIYKKAKEIVEKEFSNLESESSKKDNCQSIELKDIYHKIEVPSDFFKESIKNKRIILEAGLKEYLVDKIIESFYDLSKLAELSKLTTFELMLILANQIPVKEHNKLNHLVHVLLNFAGNIQNYEIIWMEETDDSLITSPKIEYDEEGRWDKLITHRETTHEKILEVVYDEFFNNFMSENKHKSKKRTNE